jgi:DNA helicase-4
VIEFRDDPSELIDRLIDHWPSWDLHEEFYLTTLAPRLVANPDRGDIVEKAILRTLRRHLNANEWSELPRTIAERRAGIFREIESERLRREALERARQEEARERLRQEQIRNRTEALERARQEVERIAAQERQQEEARERLRQEQIRKEAEGRRVSMLRGLRARFHSDFLSAESFFEASCDGVITEEEFEAEKVAFVRQWLAGNTTTKNGAQQSPDNEQVAAIAAVHGHIQVVARAGSGKTTTLVNRAFFLLKHCRVSPAEMLILAFNRKAALEVRRRLLALIESGADSEISTEVDRRIREAGKNKRINRDAIVASAVDAIADRMNVTLPHVMTFHALAYAIVHPEESLLYDEPESDSHGLSRVFQRVINDQLQDPDFRNEVRKLMLAHWREDWDRIVEGGYNQNKEDLLRFRRSLARVALGGEYVKSHGERIIANFLFEHDIPYRYEQNHWWNGRNYRPDFTIYRTPNSGVIIEYFGLKGAPDYDEMSAKKRDYWRTKRGWTLIEFSGRDISREGVEAFLVRLKNSLVAQGVTCERLTEEEIWERIEDRAIRASTRAFANFVGRCRKYSWAPSDLQDQINSYSPLTDVEALFLDLSQRLYVAYLRRLSSAGEEDFNGLMQRAAEMVSQGGTRFERGSGAGDLGSLRYLCIDEFQDFSDLFYRLLTAIRKANPAVALFCVGDDWQAINGFAGSDLRFFKSFGDHFGESRRLYISTNYRSATAIVAVGNVLMTGLGRPASGNKSHTGKVLIADLNEFEPSLIEKERHQGDIITPAVSRLASDSLAAGKDVVMLSRRNGLPWFVNYPIQNGRIRNGLDSYHNQLRSLFSDEWKERISISTVHKYKGLEKSLVIVLDAVARSYPLIHPDWVFSRIFGDSLENIAAEERRLLYVALTRAVDTLVIVTDGSSKSPFLEELERAMPLSAIDWGEYAPVGGLVIRMVVKVGNQKQRGGAPTFAIKDLLKASGYKYEASGWPCWVKSFPASGFRIDAVKAEVWTEPADGIEVRILDDTENLVANYLIDNGVWVCVIDNLPSFTEATGR